MRRTLTLIATAAFALGLATSAGAAKIDKNGRCHDDSGKFAKAEVCKGGASAMAAKPATPAKAAAAAPTPMAAAAPAAAAPVKGQKCKNDKGKFAKCGTPGAKPVA